MRSAGRPTGRTPRGLDAWPFGFILFPGSSLGARGERETDMQRMTWDEICRCEDYRGRWVALDECHYDATTGRATDGTVVDVDDDLVELCERLKASKLTSCAILFCTSH